MATNSKRRIGWIVAVVVVLAVVAGVVVKSRAPAKVEVIHPRRGRILESFREPARTRLDRTYPITMPIAGRIERIDLEPGDTVRADQALVKYDLERFDRALEEAEAAVRELEATLKVKRDDRIETTGLTQSLAAVDAAKEAVKAAQEQVKAEKARADRAAKQLERMEALARTKAIPQTVLDDARLEAETTLIALREKEFNHAAIKAMLVVTELMPNLIRQYISKKDLEEKVLTHQLAQAQARLAQTRHDRELARILSPITGKVLERYEQGDQSLPAGQKLLLLGDLDRLEVIADVLTEDALRIAPGSEVILEPAAGFGSLPGKVKRIEPAGFTKLSSLGVEQQRVNVIVGFDEKPEKLGVGYRLRARFITGAKTDALILPRFAVMQSPEGDYYVFKLTAGALKKQPVTLGLTSDVELEITDGVTEKDLVVTRPDATMKEEMKVKPQVKE